MTDINKVEKPILIIIRLFVLKTFWPWVKISPKINTPLCPIHTHTPMQARTHTYTHTCIYTCILSITLKTTFSILKTFWPGVDISPKVSNPQTRTHAHTHTHTSLKNFNLPLQHNTTLFLESFESQSFKTSFFEKKSGGPHYALISFVRSFFHLKNDLTGKKETISVLIFAEIDNSGQI